MAEYIITDQKTGQKYKVSGDGTPEEALAEFESQMRSSQPQSTWDRLTKPEVAQDPGMLWPRSKDAQGEGQWDFSAGLPGAVGRAVTLPYDVIRGNVQMMDPNTGRTSDEAIQRSNEAAAVLSPASRAGTPLPGAANPLRKQTAPTPSPDDLFAAGRVADKEIMSSGATYPVGAVQKFPDYVAARMREYNGREFTPDASPRTFAMLERLRTPQPGAQYSSIQDLYRLRGNLQDLTKVPEERGAAVAAIKSIDEFIRRFGDMAPPTGPSTLPVRGRPVGSTSAARKKVADLIDERNANFAAGYRGDLLDNIDYKTVMQTQSTNSGQNLGNKYRQKVAAALIKDKEKGKTRTTELTGFNDAEKQMLEGVSIGSPAANITRDIGNSFGGGGWGSGLQGGLLGGLAYQAGGGLAGAILAGAAPVAIGRASKGVSNRLSQRAFKEARDRILQRSPLYQKEAARPRLGASQSPSTEAIIRALVAGQMQAE